MIWKAIAMWPVAESTLMKVSVPENRPLYSLMGTSACGIGTLKRVPATVYSVFWVTNGDEWLPAEFGISMISSVSNDLRLIRATRGVLFALTNTQRPSDTP